MITAGAAQGQPLSEHPLVILSWRVGQACAPNQNSLQGIGDVEHTQGLRREGARVARGAQGRRDEELGLAPLHTVGDLPHREQVLHERDGGVGELRDFVSAVMAERSSSLSSCWPLSEMLNTVSTTARNSSDAMGSIEVRNHLAKRALQCLKVLVTVSMDPSSALRGNALQHTPKSLSQSLRRLKWVLTLSSAASAMELCMFCTCSMAATSAELMDKACVTHSVMCNALATSADVVTGLPELGRRVLLRVLAWQCGLEKDLNGAEGLAQVREGADAGVDDIGRVPQVASQGMRCCHPAVRDIPPEPYPQRAQGDLAYPFGARGLGHNRGHTDGGEEARKRLERHLAPHPALDLVVGHRLEEHAADLWANAGRLEQGPTEICPN